jgi:Flp pilus assembly protein TadG
MGKLVRRIARRSEKGAELVELALISPVLFLVLLGIADVGLLFQAQAVVTNAAHEGARMAALTDSQGYSTTDVQNRVKSFLQAGVPGFTAANLTTNVTRTTGSIVSDVTYTVAVQYTYSYKFIGGVAQLFGKSFAQMTIKGTSTVRAEGIAGM